MLERTLERAACTYAKSIGFLTWKLTSPMTRGVPDRLFISPKGAVVFIEFKSKTGQLTPLQKRIKIDLEIRKCNYHLVNDLQDFKKIIFSYV